MSCFLENIYCVHIGEVEWALSAAAFKDTSAQITPRALIHIPNTGGTLLSAEQILWYDCLEHLPPSVTHILTIQYDGWVLKGHLWRDAWRQYDYIGAPWPWHADRRVGNGGFSLRSVRLMRFLAAHREALPVTSPEDDTLCRNYRPFLETQGFRWAPESEARAFAFEREAPRPAFGFHGLWNWPHVLTPSALRERMALATPYARSKIEWKELEANAQRVTEGKVQG